MLKVLKKKLDTALKDEAPISRDVIYLYIICNDSPFKAFKYATSSNLKKDKQVNTMSIKPIRGRIGILSSDFYDQHPGMFLMEGIFDSIVKKKVPLYIYSDTKQPFKNDRIYTKLKKIATRFYDLEGKSDNEIALQICSDQIDTLIDRNLFTRGDRANVYASKPASKVCRYLGMPSSSGDSNIDYMVADNYVLPEKDEKFYSEKIVRLPSSYMITSRPKNATKSHFSKKDLGLPEDKIILGAFNHAIKLSEQCFLSWLRILKQSPQAILWILSNNPASQKNLINLAVSNHIDPSQIIFASKVSKNYHLERLKQVDLCLDTFIYNGHTTTLDALYSGAPVLTLPGDQFASRVSGSMLSTLNMPELISKTIEEYERTALELIHSPEALSSLRFNIKNQHAHSELFNPDLFTDRLLEILNI